MKPILTYKNIVIFKKKGLQLRGAIFGDPKRRETLFTVSRHCDLYEKKKVFTSTSTSDTTTEGAKPEHAADLLIFFLFFMTSNQRPSAIMKK